jgi:hypothetical protein
MFIDTTILKKLYRVEGNGKMMETIVVAYYAGLIAMLKDFVVKLSRLPIDKNPVKVEEKLWNNLIHAINEMASMADFLQRLEAVTAADKLFAKKVAQLVGQYNQQIIEQRVGHLNFVERSWIERYLAEQVELNADLLYMLTASEIIKDAGLNNEEIMAEIFTQIKHKQ